jgi:hypothetical protein
MTTKNMDSTTAGSMNDNINMDSTTAGSMNDNINMDSTTAGSMNVLPLEIQLSRGSVKLFNHVPSNGLDFQHHMSWSFYVHGRGLGINLWG